MKCQVLLINRNRARLYQKGEYSANAGFFKKSFRQGNEAFYIPDKAVPIELEIKRGKTVPLFLVNELTACALTSEFIAEPDTEQTEQIPVTVEPESPRERIRQDRAKQSLVPIDYQKKGQGGQLRISERSDPATRLKLNVLVKQAFWEMLAKQLKLKLLATLVYMGAGYGLFRFAEYVVRIIFLKEG